MSENGLGRSLLLLLSSWAAVTFLVWGAFEKVDRVANRRVRHRAARWLSKVRFGHILQTEARIFTEAFDTVFGRRLLTWRAFGLSAIFSLLFTVAMWTLLLAIEPRARPPAGYYHGLAGAIVFGLLVINIPADYLSLLKSRYWIGQMSRAAAWEIPLLLLIDVATSLAIGVIVYAAASGLMFTIDPPVPLQPVAEGMGAVARFSAFFWFTVQHTLDHQAARGRLSPYVLATLMTSIWAFFTSISGFLVRTGLALDSTATLFRRYLDVEQQPFSSLGAACAAVITLLYAGIALGLVIAHVG